MISMIYLTQIKATNSFVPAATFVQQCLGLHMSPRHTCSENQRSFYDRCAFGVVLNDSFLIGHYFVCFLSFSSERHQWAWSRAGTSVGSVHHFCETGLWGVLSTSKSSPLSSTAEPSWYAGTVSLNFVEIFWGLKYVFPHVKQSKNALPHALTLSVFLPDKEVCRCDYSTRSRQPW